MPDTTPPATATQPPGPPQPATPTRPPTNHSPSNNGQPQKRNRPMITLNEIAVRHAIARRRAERPLIRPATRAFASRRRGRRHPVGLLARESARRPNIDQESRSGGGGPATSVIVTAKGDFARQSHRVRLDPRFEE